MTETDCVLMLVAAVILPADRQLQQDIDTLAQTFELQEPQKPGVVSLGGKDDRGELLNFPDWLQWLRGKKPAAVRFRYAATDRPGLPAHMAAAFSGTIDLAMEVLTEDGGHAFVLATRLSPVHELTAGQFAALIDAQKDPAPLWTRIHELVDESNRLNDGPSVSRDEIARYLSGEEGRDVFEFLADQLLAESQIECKVGGSVFVMPDALRSNFYPSDGLYDMPEEKQDDLFARLPDMDERERLRARERGISKGKWQIELNKHPWRFLFFERVGRPDENVPLPPAAQARDAFAKDLADTEAFAARTDSPFAEAFRLAQFFLEKPPPVRNFSEDSLAESSALIRENGFSPRAETALENNIFFPATMMRLGWPAEKAAALLAILLCDVFGGMGSWNDTGYDDPADQAAFEDLSARLFRSRKEYFAALISSEAGRTE